MTRHNQNRPTDAELVRMSDTMTAPKVARKLGVAETTARAWMRSALATIKPAACRDRAQNWSPLALAHKGDIEAMRRDMQATELGAMAVRFERQKQSIYKWERELGVKCRRICIDCGGEFPASEIAARSDGRPTCRCMGCASSATGKPKADILSVREVPIAGDPLVQMLRVPMSRETGTVRYWASRGMWMAGGE